MISFLPYIIAVLNGLYLCYCTEKHYDFAPNYNKAASATEESPFSRPKSRNDGILALRLYESRKRPSAPTTDSFTSKRSQKHHVGVQHTLLDDGSGERKESEFLQSWHNDGNEGTIWKIAQSPPKDDILQCRVPFIMDLVYPPLHCSRKSCRNVRLGEKLCDALLLPVCIHKTE